MAVNAEQLKLDEAREEKQEEAIVSSEDQLATTSFAVEEPGTDFQLQLKETEKRLVKWLLGVACVGVGATSLLMAKGFGWIAF